MIQRSLWMVSAGCILVLAACYATLAQTPKTSLDAPNRYGAQAPCQPLSFENVPFTVCRFDLERDVPRLFLRGEEGAIIATFDRLAAMVEERGETLVFAMNAGMYDRKRRPIGLYVEDAIQEKSANTKDGYGNFHLMPNGIFFVSVDGANNMGVGVMETSAFVDAHIDPLHATQSGPMLVINGDLHPRFFAASSSRKRRNGVGVSADGKTIWFAISDAPVNFHGFARLFRDQLQTPNALFLDGEVSKLYAPNLGRNDKGLPMGPMIAITRSIAKCVQIES